MDLISVVSYWTCLISVFGTGRRPWSIFQSLAAVRLLRLLVITEGTSVIMTSLNSSYDMLKNVMGFFVFLWLLFSLTALFIFTNAFSRRCAVMTVEDGLSYVEPRLSCSGYYSQSGDRVGPLDINTGLQYANHGGDGQFCPRGQICIQDVANQPEHGYMSYQNIFSTMLNVLTVISTENWTDLLYISQDSVSRVGAAVFYVVCIYLMTFVMVPMFIAVITTSFSHVRGDMRESAFSSQRKAGCWISKHRQDSEGGGGEWIYEEMGLANGLERTRSRVKGWIHFIVHQAWFQYIGSLVVVMDLVMMSFYHSKLLIHEKEQLGRIFTCVFAVEIILRIYGSLDWNQFWSRIRNRVDLVIAVLTLIDEWPSMKESKYHVYLLIFAVLRSYRVAYLFPGVLQLLSDAVGDGQGILNLTFFTFLVLFLLAPISVQLFGGDFKFVDEPSMRFDNSYQAFLALFQIMTGENWTDILYDAMHSQKSSSVSYAAIFMIFLYFTVHYMVLNLFIAVIMENFDLDEEEIKQIQIKKYIREHRWKPEYFKMDRISRFLLPLFIVQDEKKLDFKNIPQNLVAHVTSSRFKEFLGEIVHGEDTVWGAHHTTSALHQNLAYFALHNQDPCLSRVRRSSSITTQVTEPLVKYGDEYELNVARENKAVVVENLNVFRSMFILKNDHIIRKVCSRLVSLKSYNWFIIGLIGISTLLAMWADTFNRQKHPVIIDHVFIPLHLIFLLIYWLDIAVHMIVDGVCMLPKSYMRNTWNLLDIINLLCQTCLTILSIFGDSSLQTTTNYASYIRILSTLRSVRIVYYVDGMRVIFLDLIYGLPKMIDAVALNMLVFVPFAIYGCFLFSGRFSLCNDGTALSRQACFGEFRSEDDENLGILLPRVWKNPYDYSFDTFGKSILHLFECASGEGWILSLFSAMSVVPEDRDAQPQFSWSSSSIFHSIYYVVFMFVASLCSIQLFIGVFLEIFKQRNGISSLTNTQRQFQDLQRQLELVKPSLKAKRPPDGTLRATFYDLITDKRGRFDHFMATVLMANIVYGENLKFILYIYIYICFVRRAFPSIFFVSFVFGIVMICFGVIFQEQFSFTRYGPYGNEHANFRSLFNTLLTLFRITTGENWDFLMHDFTILPPECSGKGDCGSPKYAIILFISFYVVCTFIFVNLVTVIVIDNFSFTFDKRNQFTLITRTDLRNFKLAWSSVDPKATGYINIHQVPKFLSLLEGVLAVNIYEKEHSLSTLLEASNQVDADVSHLIAVPLSNAKTSTNSNKNAIGERFFNLHELNRRLANIDPQTIKDRQRQYTEVYQEIINSASHRGVAFHNMLEILAIRLVDVSKSLTFNELVNRARIQDKVAKELAKERAKGLVAMLILRRKYLKRRQSARINQALTHHKNSNSLSLVGNWLMPNKNSNHKLSSSIRSASTSPNHSYLQLGTSLSKSSKGSNAHRNSIPNKRGGSPRSIDSTGGNLYDLILLITFFSIQDTQNN
ncbi:MAG: Ion transport protein-domain-containing protein [Benjaminiella poitrasii]|nr:MAG: Ion transport protein-domain-containing protein [Benjaminiella poitrasii]